MTDTIKHCTTDFSNSVLCLVSCSSINNKSSPIFHTEQSCDRPKFDTSAA